MVRCRSCGFENRTVDVCAKCGSSIQRYVKLLPLCKRGDVSTIKEELNAGNVLIVNVLPFLKKKEGAKPPNVAVLGSIIEELHRYALSVGGDIARIGAERVILAPSSFKIGRPSKPNLLNHEPLFRECPYCGESIKISNINRHMAKVHCVPDWAETATVTQGNSCSLLS